MRPRTAIANPVASAQPKGHSCGSLRRIESCRHFGKATFTSCTLAGAAGIPLLRARPRREGRRLALGDVLMGPQVQAKFY